MRKLQYEAPELRIALTEKDILTMDAIGNSAEFGTDIGGEEITEKDN